MIKNLILPMKGVIVDYQHGERLYFLAGPNEGGGCWQKEAIKQLLTLDPNCIIATSCESDHCKALVEGSLEPSFEKVKGNGKRSAIVPKLSFANNTMWRKYYMEEASYHGTIIFWLPEESYPSMMKFSLDSYAQSTYSEIARWSVKSANPNEFSLDKHIFKGGRVNMVIGAEPGFPGLINIQESLDADHDKSYIIYSSLAETIAAGVELAMSTNAFPKSLPK